MSDPRKPALTSNEFASGRDDDLFRLELFISRLLRYGVLVSGALMLAGWLSQIDFSHNTFADFHDYQTIPLTQSLRELWQAREWGLLTSYWGLALLISLPLLRVTMTGLLFIKNREYLLAGIVSIVLMGLLLSFVLGFEL